MESKTTKEQILAFANQVQVCHLATSEDNQPHVRGMLLWFADETGFYFHTSTEKRLPKQIIKNQNVEAAFMYHSEKENSSQALRVTGKAEILENEELTARLLNERPWLKSFEQIAPQAKLFLFRIINAEAFFWNMEHNMRENEIPRVKF